MLKLQFLVIVCHEKQRKLVFIYQTHGLLREETMSFKLSLKK